MPAATPPGSPYPSEMGQPHVEHGAPLFLKHHSQTLGDRGLDVLWALDAPRIGAPRRGGDAGIVRRRIEAQIQILGAAGEAIRMNGEGRKPGRFPAAIVINDLQEWRA